MWRLCSLPAQCQCLRAAQGCLLWFSFLQMWLQRHELC